MLEADDSDDEIPLRKRAPRVEQADDPGEHLDEIGLGQLSEDSPPPPKSTQKKKPAFNFDDALAARDNDGVFGTDEINNIKDYLQAAGLALTEDEKALLHTMADPSAGELQDGTEQMTIDFHATDS